MIEALNSMYCSVLTCEECFHQIYSEYKVMFRKFSSLTFVCNLKVINCPYVMGELIVSDLNGHCILPTQKYTSCRPTPFNQMCFSLRFVLV